jgi:hypothetical protein
MIKNIYSKLLLSFILCVLYTGVSEAQVSEGGTPYSFSQYFKQVVASNPGTRLKTKSIDVPKQSEIKSDIEAGLLPASPFAKAVYVDFDWNNSGTWIDLPNGDRIWQLRIYAIDAISLHLIAKDFVMPEGAKLFVYNDLQNTVLGAFTERHNQEHKTFTSEVLEGDNLIIEYYEPANVRGKGSMHITRIDYGFKPIQWEEVEENPDEYRLKSSYKTSDISGTCNINVLCPPAQNWQEHKRSVARIVVATSTGSGLCSGALVNNTNFDGKPYFQTAFHCERSPEGVTINYESWQFRFNFEANACEHGSPNNPFTTVTGCTFKGRVPEADYVLVELNPLPAAVNPYFLGWNRGGTSPTSAVGIHHPRGEPKKFSFTDGTISVNTSQNTFTGGFSLLIIPAGGLWTFSWAINGGTTEGGSSGSPLLNQDGHTVGVLTGGSSNCNNPQGFNAYGRLFTAWFIASPFLDPNANAGLSLAPYDPNATFTNVKANNIELLVTPCELSTQTPFSVLINNAGGVDVTDVPVTVRALHTNGDILDEATYTVSSLAVGQTNETEVNLDLSAENNYTIRAFTSLSTDQDANDNSIEIAIENKIATIPSSSLVLDNSTLLELGITWQRGDGEGSIVLLKKGSDFTPADLPVDGVSYSFNPNIATSTSTIGNAFVIYRGASLNNIIARDLEATENYFVTVLEFSCNPPVFLRSNALNGNSIVTNLAEETFRGLSVYPNPVNRYQLSIEIPNYQGQVDLKILSSNGIEVSSFNTRLEGGNRSIILDTQSLTGGLYLVKIQTSNGVITRKIAIE